MCEHKQTGFTLVELIMVIIITGILSGMVAVFIRTPIDQYIDIARRAEMTDIADTALRRMGRDIRTAVPNSVRLSGSYLEFLPTKTGGRYRANPAPSGIAHCGGTLAEDILDFTILTGDSCFEIIGAAINFSVGDTIVVGSTQADGLLPYDTSINGVLRAYTDSAGLKTAVVMAGAAQFPASATNLEGQRFEVISESEQAVTYSCENVGGTTDGTGTLKRYWHYGFNPIQIAPPVGGFSALLADKISACSIVYNNIHQRNGLVAISLTIMQGGESINLYSEIHVNNLP